MSLRLSTDHERNTLKTASRAAIGLVGPAKQLCAVSRIGEAQVSRCINRDESDFFAIDVALEADRLAGSPVITSALADLLGYRLVPIEGDPEPTYTAADCMDLVQKAVSAMQELRDADADGIRTEAERRSLAERLTDVVREAQDALRGVINDARVRS